MIGAGRRRRFRGFIDQPDLPAAYRDADASSSQAFASSSGWPPWRRAPRDCCSLRRRRLARPPTSSTTGGRGSSSIPTTSSRWPTGGLASVATGSSGSPWARRRPPRPSRIVRNLRRRGIGRSSMRSSARPGRHASGRSAGSTDGLAGTSPRMTTAPGIHVAIQTGGRGERLRPLTAHHAEGAAADRRRADGGAPRPPDGGGRIAAGFSRSSRPGSASRSSSTSPGSMTHPRT